MKRNRPRQGASLWIDEPGAAEAIAERTADPALRRSASEMLEKGYAVLPAAVPGERCDAAVEAFHGWCAGRPDEVESFRDAHGHLPRLVNFHLANDAFGALFFENAAALELQDFLFGYRTSLYTSLFFERGTQQPVHRDAPYFCTHPRNFYFGMWVALEDTDAENGPLFLVEGGHRIGEIDPAEVSAGHRARGEPLGATDLGLWQGYQDRVEAHYRERGLTGKRVTLRKGDTLIWHPLLPHGGEAISDLSRTRFSAVFHTTPEHVPVYQGDVFFDPDARPSPDPTWKYRVQGGRLVADHPGGWSFQTA